MYARHLDANLSIAITFFTIPLMFLYNTIFKNIVFCITQTFLCSPVVTAPKLQLSLSQPSSGWAGKQQWYTGIMKHKGILRERGPVVKPPNATETSTTQGCVQESELPEQPYLALQRCSLTCDKLFKFSEPHFFTSRKGQIIILISQGFWWRWNYVTWVFSIIDCM